MLRRGKGYRRGIAALLVMLALTVAPLAGGLALEIETLPETWEELCELVPDMPNLEPENVQVRFPHTSDKNELNFSFLCDDEEWPDAFALLTNAPAFSPELAYDAGQGAYMLTEQGANNLANAMWGEAVDGAYFLGKQDGDWLITIAFYVGRDAFMALYEAEEPLTRSWDNVVSSDTSSSNYLMPCIIAVHATQSGGELQIYQYATHTLIRLCDADGNAVAFMKYPEFSPFCADFMPVDPLQ